MPIPTFLKGLFSGKGKEIASTVVDGLDNLFTSKEEKLQKQLEIEKMVNDHIEKMESLAIEETKAFLADTANARDNNTKIQESDKASWMSKNIAYCIDAFITLLWGVLTIYLIASALKIIKTNQVDLTGIYGLYAAVTGVTMTIINFHRGSSVGSERKQKQMEKMMEK